MVPHEFMDSDRRGSYCVFPVLRELMMNNPVIEVYVHNNNKPNRYSLGFMFHIYFPLRMQDAHSCEDSSSLQSAHCACAGCLQECSGGKCWSLLSCSTVCLQWNPSIVATLVLAIIQYSMYTVEPLYSGHVGPCYHTVLTVCIQWNPSIVATLVLVIVQYLQYVYNGTPL